MADRAYFRKPRSVKAPLMAVRYGRELQSFKVDFSYLDVKVRVMGYNPKTQAGISAERKVSAFLSQTRLLAETPVLSVADTDADSREKAGIRAEAWPGSGRNTTALAPGVPSDCRKSCRGVS